MAASRNRDDIMVLGSARPLLEAFQHATSELQRWLMTDYGFTERGAQTLWDKLRNTRSQTWSILTSPSLPRFERICSHDDRGRSDFSGRVQN